MPEALAFWSVAPGRGELRSERLRRPGAGEAQVRTIASGISRGTESLVFHGLVPESQWTTMRAPFQAGDFPFPVKYGYSALGVVEEGDPSWLGRRVFCLHPHQDRFIVPVGALRPVPDAVPDRRAVLAANLETAINALWDAPVRVGDRVAVVGGGVIGTLIAVLAAAHPGVELTLVEPERGKIDRLSALGLHVVPPGEARGGADVVVHASSTGAGLADALDLAGPEAIVLEVSWHGARPVEIPLGGAFHDRRLTLRSSQVGRLPPERLARWDGARRLDLALRLLADDRFDGLLEAARPFADLPAVMADVTGPQRSIMCQVIVYK